jgi:hypothetical protein
MYSVCTYSPWHTLMHKASAVHYQQLKLIYNYLLLLLLLQGLTQFRYVISLTLENKSNCDRYQLQQMKKLVQTLHTLFHTHLTDNKQSSTILK